MRLMYKAILSISLLGVSISSPHVAWGQATTLTAVPSDASLAPSLAQLRLMIDHGRADEALKNLDGLRLQKPMPPGVDRLRGLAFYAQGKYADANTAFAVALQSDPHDEESTQMRGLTLFRLGKPTEAIPLLEGAHEWTMQSKVDPSYVLALCYLDTRRYDDARRAFASQYGFPVDSASAYLLAARMLLRREYVPVAQEYARKALELDHDLPLAHKLLGEIALAEEHLDEAISEFEKERVRNPLDGGLYDRLGDAYLRSGNYPMAQQALQRAVLLEPNFTGPYILLGKVMLKRQDPIGAATYLERAVSMDPANYMTHSLLGQSYRAMGRTEDAAREMQRAQKIQAADEPKLETTH
jgi:predicted Zn-dependent protease